MVSSRAFWVGISHRSAACVTVFLESEVREELKFIGDRSSIFNWNCYYFLRKIARKNDKNGPKLVKIVRCFFVHFRIYP